MGISQAFRRWMSGRGSSTPRESAVDALRLVAPPPDAQTQSAINAVIRSACRLAEQHGARLGKGVDKDLATLQRLLDETRRPLPGDMSLAVDLYLGEMLRLERDGVWGLRHEDGRPRLLVVWEVKVPGLDRSGSIQAVEPRGAADDDGHRLREWWQATVEREAAISRMAIDRHRLDAIGMRELLDAGLLAPDDRLETRHEGHPGQVLADGRIEVNGVAYDDPTSAFRALGNTIANYGWGPWLVVRADGSRPSLDDLRHELLARG